MQFVIKRDILLKSLNFVQGVVEKKNTLPILSNVLLQLKENKLSIVATDLDIIFYDEKKIFRKNLTLPHKEFSQRSFVIVPFYEIDTKQKKHLSKKFKNFLKKHKDLKFFLRDII